MYKNLPLVCSYRLGSGAVKFRTNVSSSRAWILVSSLAVLLTILVLRPAVGRTQVVLSPGTESSAGGAIDAWLVKRGLIPRGLTTEQSSTDTVTPPLGIEVDETRQTENRTGEVLNRVKSWNETAADDTVHFEITTLSRDQFEVAFWLFPNHRKGCTLYQWTLYDHGRALQSAFWRNDAAVLRLAGAADLPPDLYPDSVPWIAFLRVLDAPRDGAEGMLHQQITPYSYVGQQVWAKGPEEISVSAGTFSALAVTAQVDVATVMPNWPRFVLHVIEPVVPKNTLYFEAAPPYRLLKQEGTTFVGGPEVTTELIRTYIAGTPPVVAAAAPTQSLGAPSGFGGSPILR
ncbi:MAG: hypothetical protein WA740_01790 [Candidatus Binataceae bacterium]